jgi:hypothetical protein
MIYNQTLPSQYGTFPEIGEITNILITKPKPSPEDYNKGYITRVFVKKINENVINEISYVDKSSINLNLYKTVQVKWKITGPKNNIYKGNILDKAGVTEQNRFEIDRIKKEEGIDLSGVLNNPLEYWRGN